MRKFFPQITLIFFVAVFFALLAFDACPSPAFAAPSRRQLEEQKEFASFIDGFIAGVQKDWHIPGLAFVAVKDGVVLYQKGYGHMGDPAESPVIADKTLFRIGSVSKPVTTTAVMQLAEKGRISLDEDVNNYLRRWRLSNGFQTPVTVRHLLTHTAGFDDKVLEICASTSADERGYAARLPKIMPARYAEAGTFYSYSNMSYALLGSIVERYSRQNFPAAVKKHIFLPLGMQNSTFSPTDDEMKRLARGYLSDGTPIAYSYRYDMPAVGMSSTASDMGCFMLAQLDEGRLGRTRILGQMYAGSMLRRHFSPHPKIAGTGLGYYEKTVSGLRTLQQSGNINGYSSFLMLIPEKNFGLFYAANISDLDFRNDIASAVIDRFFPSTPVSGDVLPMRQLPIPPDVAGYYRSNRISRHSAEKILHLFSDQIRVSIVGNEILLEHTRNKTRPVTHWIPSGEPDGAVWGDLFRRAGISPARALREDAHMFFQRDAAGKVSALVIGGVRHTYDRLRPYESYPWQLGFLAVFALIVFLSLLGVFLGITINKSKLPWEKGLRAATELWTISLLFCAIQIAFIVGLVLSSFYIGDEFAIFVPYQVKALFVIPLAGGLLLAWFWFRIFATLLNPDHHWAEKMALILLALGETAYMFFLANWRLLGFMF